MREYSVSVNGNLHKVRASKTSVAVKRALDKYTESQLDCAHIKVASCQKINYAYRCIADVPCEPEGSTKRDYVTDVMSLQEAHAAVATLRATRPDLRNIWYRRVELSA